MSIRRKALRFAGKKLNDAAELSSRRESRTLRRIKSIAIFGAVSGTALGVTAGLAATYAGYRLLRGWNAADLNGQVVLITGSSRGLGLAMAREFAKHGCKLVLCARDPEELQRAVADLARSGIAVLGIPCDVGDRQQVDRMVQQAIERYGRIDVLVNNAGIITVGPMESQNIEEYEDCMRTMFWGAVYPTLAVLPHMIERRSGRIANITSIGGKVAVPHLLPYTCAKFACVGFSEGLRAELSRHNIKVTTVVPWLMRTGSHVNATFKGKYQAEYSLFSLSATLPVVAMNAERAARRIVSAVRRGAAEIVLTPQAKAAVIVHGIAPGLTSNVLGLLNRALPGPGTDRSRHLGKESETAVSRSFLTALGRHAAHELNQQPDRRTELQRGSNFGPQPAVG